MTVLSRNGTLLVSLKEHIHGIDTFAQQNGLIFSEWKITKLKARGDLCGAGHCNKFLKREAADFVAQFAGFGLGVSTAQNGLR